MTAHPSAPHMLHDVTGEPLITAKPARTVDGDIVRPLAPSTIFATVLIMTTLVIIDALGIGPLGLLGVPAGMALALAIERGGLALARSPEWAAIDGGPVRFLHRPAREAFARRCPPIALAAAVSVFVLNEPLRGEPGTWSLLGQRLAFGALVLTSHLGVRACLNEWRTARRVRRAAKRAERLTR